MPKRVCPCTQQFWLVWSIPCHVCTYFAPFAHFLDCPVKFACFGGSPAQVGIIQLAWPLLGFYGANAGQFFPFIGHFHPLLIIFLLCFLSFLALHHAIPPQLGHSEMSKHQTWGFSLGPWSWSSPSLRKPEMQRFLGPCAAGLRNLPKMTSKRLRQAVTKHRRFL